MQNPKSHFFFDAKDSSSFRQTSQSVLRLNSAAYQESLVAPSLLSKHPPQEAGKGASVGYFSLREASDYRSFTVGAEDMSNS